MNLSVSNFILEDKTIYTGEILASVRKRKIPHGKGKAIMANGDIYVGHWSLGKPNGNGLYIKPKYSKYSGAFKDGKMCGMGRMEFENQPVFCMEGEWIDDKLTGCTRIIYSDGSEYRGYVNDFVREGFGVYHYADGTIIKGKWANNEIVEISSIIRKDIRVKIFDHDRTKCRIKYADGSVYVGCYDQLYRPNIHGKMKYSDGSIYIGHWNAGVKQGIGFLLKNNKDYYNGEWTDDQMHGIGIYSYAGVHAIEFTWENGKQTGILRMYHY